MAAYTNNSGAYDRIDFSNIEQFQIIGTSANDSIITGRGNDIIIGVNPNSNTPGRGEIDTLTGGAGSDKFILGDLDWIGYDDGNNATNGDTDYALIVDFNPIDGDVIQLQGTSSTFVLQTEGINTQILIDKPDTEADEVIAVLQNITDLNLTDNYFHYITPTLAIAPSNAVQTEGNSGNKAFTFTVNRTGNTTGTNSVNWGVTGSGTNPANAADFGGTLPTGTVSFAANETSKTITVNVSGDTLVETDDTFTVTLSNPSNGATITTATATGTIQNDDTSLAIAPTNAVQTEGNSGNKAFTFTVNRTGNTTGTNSVNWGVTGSGTNPANAADFGGTLPTGTVSFAANETSKTITVNVSGDTLVETDDTFTVTLSKQRWHPCLVTQNGR